MISIPRKVLFGCALVLTGLLLSCKDPQQDDRAPYENDLGIKPAVLAQIDSVHYTTIRWINPDQDFGVIRYGDSVRVTFSFENTGGHPLFLSSVRTSCGCTVPRYTEKAIMPGERNEITAVFNSIGQADVIHKTITVRTNTSNGVDHLLTIRGKVERSQEKDSE